MRHDLQPPRATLFFLQTRGLTNTTEVGGWHRSANARGGKTVTGLGRAAEERRKREGENGQRDGRREEERNERDVAGRS